MSTPLTIEIDLAFTTPAFLGDADQKAALRPQSFKGLLRFWYRALDGSLAEKKQRREDELWGGAGDDFGQSPILLRLITRKPPQIYQWRRESFTRFTERAGKYDRNGLLYLGFPFTLRGNEQRNGLSPGTSCTFRVVIPRHNLLGEWQRKAVVATLWLFAVLGSCGSRSRRGFGSMQAMNWRIRHGSESWQDVFNALPNPGTMSTPSAWDNGINTAFALFYGEGAEAWFPRFDNAAHPHLTHDFSPIILKGFPTWEEAMNHGGRKLQNFRQCLEPDKSAVIKLLENPHHGTFAPGRTTFGLPLKFQFRSRKELGSVTFYPQRLHPLAKSSDRFASLLFLKIIRLGMSYHPVFFRLQGALPGFRAPLGCVLTNKKMALNLDDPQENILDHFLQSLGGAK
ncbi:MAG: RAMP superfamily CRISPR-associated protein [Thermodesulfobacteriota bacterium]